MSKKNTIRIAIILGLALMMSMVSITNMSVAAKKAPSLSRKSLTAQQGKWYTIKVKKNGASKIISTSWKLENAFIGGIKSETKTSVKYKSNIEGSNKIIAKIKYKMGKKTKKITLKCPVYVEEKQKEPEPTVQPANPELARWQVQFDDIASMAYTKGTRVEANEGSDLGISYQLASPMQKTNTGNGEYCYWYMVITYYPESDTIDLYHGEDFTSDMFNDSTDHKSEVIARLIRNYADTTYLMHRVVMNDDGTHFLGFGHIEAKRSNIHSVDNNLSWEYDSGASASAKQASDLRLETWYKDINPFLYEQTGYTLGALGFGA